MDTKKRIEKAINEIAYPNFMYGIDFIHGMIRFSVPATFDEETGETGITEVRQTVKEFEKFIESKQGQVVSEIREF